MTENHTLEKMNRHLPRLMRTQGIIYIAGAKELIGDFGHAGEESVRQWIRRYATWRGRELRKGHMAMGLPINMESLQRYWDSAVALTSQHIGDPEAGGSWAPYDVRLTVKGPECTTYHPWAEEGFWLWGHVFCEEYHQNAAQAYHPEAVVVIPQCLTKRDSFCDFRWVMPPNARKELEPIPPYPGQDVLKDWRRDTEKQTILSAMRRTTRGYAAMIYTLRQVLSEYHSEKAESKFIEILEQVAAERGSDLKKEKDGENWGSDPNNLFLNFDLPYAFIWESERKTIPGGIEIEVAYCPFAETWGWMGALSDMKPYCERTYCGIVTNYDNTLSAEVSRCKTGGDETCLIKIEKKEV